MSVQPLDTTGQAMQGPPVPATTTVVIQQPQATNGKLVGTLHGHRDWSTGLFGCMEDGSKCTYL